MPPKKKTGLGSTAKKAAKGVARKTAKRTPVKRVRAKDVATVDVDSVVADLKRKATKATLDGMARYGIPSDDALGVTVGEMRRMAKAIGRNHDLALGLWATGIYESRMLATFVDDPALVTPAQMDAWRRDFDSWAICDTACFNLFDKTPYAWDKVRRWAGLKDEFGKRAAFAMLACLTVHDKKAGDEPFAEGLALIEAASDDDRNFVKKSVNWALRSIGKRSAGLHALAVATSEKLAASTDPTARWIGKDALRELKSPAQLKRVAAKKKRTS